jgi:hypothetical protein
MSADRLNATLLSSDEMYTVTRKTVQMFDTFLNIGFKPEVLHYQHCGEIHI